MTRAKSRARAGFASALTAACAALAPVAANALAGSSPPPLSPSPLRAADPNGVCFQKAARGEPRGHSVSIIDADTGEWLGSASHLCSPFGFDQTNSMYFAAASHELEGPNGIRRIAVEQEASCIFVEMGINQMFEAPGRPILGEDVAIDSSADLAFFRVPSRAIHRMGCLSLPVGDRQSLPAVRDLESALKLPLESLAIEAVDPVSRVPTRRAFVGRVARTITSGLPGREGTGPLVMVAGERGFGGNSGGAVVKVGPPEPLWGSRSQLLGIMLAYDSVSSGRVMALLDSDLIRDRLTSYVISRAAGGRRSAASRLPLRRLEKEIDGGVEYLNGAGDAIAVHFRNGGFAFRSAGPGRLTAGRGPGRLGDGGGPGRLGDGGGLARASAAWASGIELYAHPGKRWLSIGNEWSELEPFALNLRSLLEARTPPEGVYEDASGALFATSWRAPLPTFIAENPERPDAPLVASNCRVVQAASGDASTGQPKPSAAILCLRRTEQEMAVAIAPSAGRAGQTLAFRVSLRKACAPGVAPCPLEIDARAFRITPVRDAGMFERAYFSETHAPAGALLRRDGIRTFWLDDGRACLNVERTAGFRLFAGPCGAPNAWLSGPQ